MSAARFFMLRHRDGRYVAPGLRFTKLEKRAGWFLTSGQAHECRLRLPDPDAWSVLAVEE